MDMVGGRCALGSLGTSAVRDLPVLARRSAEGGLAGKVDALVGNHGHNATCLAQTDTRCSPLPTPRAPANLAHHRRRDQCFVPGMDCASSHWRCAVKQLSQNFCLTTSTAGRLVLDRRILPASVPSCFAGISPTRL